MPLVSPDQQFFLRENLRMRLLSARVALLAHDGPASRPIPASAADWLQRYFDTNDTKVGAAVDGAETALGERDQHRPARHPASLEAVRNQKLVRERGLR